MSNQLNTRSINPTPRTQPRVVTVNTAFTVKDSDNYILISNTSAGAKVITLPDTNFIARVTIRATAVSGGGSYTATVSQGVLTFDAANEIATIISDPDAGTWAVESLFGATVV